MDDQTRQAFNDLQAAINNLASSMGNLTDAQRRSMDRQNINTKDINKDFSDLSRSVNSNSQAQDSIATANKKYAESMQQFNNAVVSSVNGLKTFTAALLDSNRNFSKYGSTVTNFGDALAGVLKALGPLGAVLGGVVQGMTKVAEAALKQADNVLKAYDDLAKVGGAGSLTSKQIMEMGLQAGLMSKDLGKLTGVIKANSKDIAGLGLTSAEGMKMFGQMTAVGSKTIAMYSKLGVSQEELIKTQGDYVALQMASGRAIGSELKDRVKLQKASLEYQDNLLMLSNLTGESVDAIKQKQKDALLELNAQIKNRQDQNKIIELEKQGRMEEAAKLRLEVENRNKGLQAVAAIGSKGLTQAIREMQASGTATSKGAQAMIRAGLGPAMAEYNKTIKEGGDANKAAAKLQQAYNEAQNRVINQVGTAAGLSQDIAESFDLTAENVQRGTQQFGKDLQAAQGQAAAAVTAGKESTDPALNARARLTQLEIEAGTALERFLAKINPLLNGFNLETVGGMVATGAAVAAATWLGGKLLSGVVGKVTGGGMPSIPSTGGIVGGGGGGSGAAGGRAGPLGGSGGRAGPLGGGRAGGRAGRGGGNVSGTLETLGQGGGSMLENAAKGLAAFANPKVAIGAAAFGAAIVAVGAGIAGATWIMSKALPSLAEGLQSFEKLDGDALVKAGKGVGALGAGLAVFGVGGAAAGIGSIIGTLGETISGFFGGKTPIQKLVEFSKLDINGKKVEENAKAFALFGAAMATGVTGVLEGVGTAVSALGGAVAKFFDIDPPFKKFVEFSKLDIDVKKTKNNAEAFVAFSGAMATGSAGILEGLGSIVSALGGAVANFFKVDPPLKKFVEFSNLNIDSNKTKTNAEAFANFSMAMAKSGLGSAASGIGNLVSGIADGIGKLFGNKDAITKFVEFTKLDVDPDKAEKLGIAFAAYVSALQGVSGAAMPAISSSRGGAAGGGAAGGGGGGGAAGGGGGGGGGTTASGASASSGAPTITATPRQVTPPAGGAAGRPRDDVEGKVSGGGGPVRQADAGDAAKGPRKKTDGIIVHHTGGRGLQGAISTLKARGLGYHYMVDQDGSVTAFVPDDQKTWHAGNTDKKPELTNSNSVSISLVSKDDTDISPTQLKSGFALGKELMNKFGVSMVFGHGETSSHKMPTEGKTLAEALRSGRLPETPKAAQGGVFTGPKSGYPVTLHGNELVIPDFKIPNMKSAMEQVTKQELPFGSTANAAGSGDNALMADLFSMMETKFDSLITAVEQSNNTQVQILKYSKA